MSKHTSMWGKLSKEEEKEVEKLRKKKSQDVEYTSKLYSTVNESLNTLSSIENEAKTGFVTKQNREKMRQAAYNLDHAVSMMKAYGIQIPKGYNIGDAHKSVDNVMSYFGQFKNEDDYNLAYDNSRFTEKYKKTTYANARKAQSDIEKQLQNDKNNDELTREFNWLKNHATDEMFVKSMTDDELKALTVDADSLKEEKIKLMAESAYLSLSDGLSSAYGMDNSKLKRKQEIQKRIAEIDATNGRVLYTDDVGAVTAEDVLRHREFDKLLKTIENDSELKKSYDAAVKAEESIATLDKQLSDLEKEKRNVQRANPTAINSAGTYAIDNQINSVAQAIKKNKDIITSFEADGHSFEDIQHYLSTKESREKYAAQQEEFKQYATEHPVKATGKAIISAPGTIIDLAGNLADTAQYGYSNVYDDEFTDRNNTYTETVSSNINDKVLEKTGSEVAAWLVSGAYSGITSSAQSALTTAGCVALFGGAGPAVALGIMSTESASSAFNNAVKNGSTNGEALITGVVNGLAEAVFEKFSLGNLFDISKKLDVSSVSKLIKSTLKETFKQGAVEGSEEFFTEISTTLADQLINGNQSEYNTTIRELLRAGYTQEEAEKEAGKQILNNILTATYGGFVGGAGTGSTVGISAGAQHNASLTDVGKAIYQNDNLQALYGEVQKLQGNEKLKKLAELSVKRENQQKAAVNNRNFRNIGRLYEGVQRANYDSLKEAGRDSVITSIEQEISNAGIEDTAKAKSVLTKALTGNLTARERAYFTSINGIDILNKAMSTEKSISDTQDAQLTGTQNLIKTAQLTEKNSGISAFSDEVNTRIVNIDDYVSEDGVTRSVTSGEEIVINSETPFVKNDNGETLINTDKGAVSIDDIEFGTKGEALIYEAFADLNPEIASVAVSSFSGDLNNVSSVKQYITGMREGITLYGAVDFDRTKLSNSSAFSKLTDDQQKAAILLGRRYTTSQVTAQKEKIASGNIRSNGKHAYTGKGKVIVEESAKGKSYSKMQHAGVEAVKVISNAFNIDIYLYDSTVDKSHANENGWYTDADDSLHIDINSGKHHEGLMIYTLSHEITHLLKEWSPDKYPVYADFVVKNFGSKAEYMLLKNVDIYGDNELAIDEMVAKASETMLLDSNALEKLASLNEKEPTIIGKIKEAIKKLLNKVRELYKNYAPQTREAQEMRNMENVLKDAAKLFEDMAVEGAKNKQKVDSKNKSADNKTSDSVVKKSSRDDVIHLSSDNDLNKKIGTLYGAEKYKIIQKYILELLGEQPIKLSDGKLAYIDKSDSLHIANKSANKKTAQISQIKNIVKNAQLFAEDLNVNHKKFNYFCYYKAMVEYEGDTFPVYLNVGRTINDGRYHIYDITNKIRDTANRINGLERPKPNEGYALTNSISTNSITKSIEKVNKKNSSRYEGLSAHELLGLTEQLEKRNAALEKDVKRLNRLVYLQNNTINKTTISPSSLDIVAKQIRKESNSNIDISELRVLLNDYYDYIRSSDELTWDEVMSRATIIAERIEQDAKKDYYKDEVYEDFLKEMRTNSFSLNDGQKKEIEYATGKPWSRSIIGRFKYSETADNLDSLWQTYSSQHPELFDASISEAQQGVALIDAYESVKELSKVLIEYDTEEKIAWIADLVYNKYWDVSTIHSLYQYQNEVEYLKKEHNRSAEEREQIYKVRYEKILDKETSKLKNENLILKNTLAKLKQESNDEYKRLILRGQERQKARVEQIDTRLEREKLEKLIRQTYKWLTNPPRSSEKCPDMLKVPLMELLSSIDTSSKRKIKKGVDTKYDQIITYYSQTLSNAVDSLAKQVEKMGISVSTDKDGNLEYINGTLYLPDGFVEQINNLSNEIREAAQKNRGSLNKMTSEQMKELARIIRTLTHSVREMSNIHQNNLYKNITELGRRQIVELNEIKSKQKNLKVAGFINWDNVLPFYVFKRFGESGMSIFTELMDAQDKFAFLSQEIEDFQNNKWKNKDVRKWNKYQTYELPSKQTVRCSQSQIMSLYCSNLREESLHDKLHIEHLTEGVTKFVGEVTRTTESKDSSVKLRREDIDFLISKLSDEQIKVATEIQKFMSTVCAKWGNEYTMKHFLQTAFTEQFYFPFETNPDSRNTEPAEKKTSDLFRLLHVSATKDLTQGASNGLVIRNIFDVFAHHAVDMAKINAYGDALLDTVKWLNYSEVKEQTDEKGKVIKSKKSEEANVRAALRRAYGGNAEKYIVKLIQDINSISKSDENGFVVGLMQRAKVASVGANLRVASLQITALPRAAAVLKQKNIIKGLSKLPDFGTAKEYSGIALWKSQGYYDINITKSLEKKLGEGRGLVEILQDASLKGAEWGDALTWGFLWNACIFEVQETWKGQANTDEFYKAVADKLREVIYSTQVVDSTLTRSQLMRDKSAKTRSFTAFMSESTLTHSILMDCIFEIQQKGLKASTKNVTKKLTAVTASVLFATVIECFFDALRDEDDESFLEKLLDWERNRKNLISNLNPFNNIPIINDIFNLLESFFLGQYFSVGGSMETELLTSIKSAWDIFWELIEKGDDSSKTWYNFIYEVTQVASYASGLPFANLMRDVVAILNTTVGSANKKLKIRKYKLSGEVLRSNIYKAIMSDSPDVDYYKTLFESDTKYQNAKRSALKEYEPRIAEAAQARDDGDMSKYESIAKEIAGEGKFTLSDAIWAITSAYNEIKPKDEEPEEPSAPSMFKIEDYVNAIDNGTSTDVQLVREYMLEEYLVQGKDEEEAESLLNNRVKNYYKDEFVEGNITSTEAERYLNNFAGKEYDEARDIVKSWGIQLKYPDVDMDSDSIIKFFNNIKNQTYELDYSLEDAGISFETYAEYYELQKECKGDLDENGKTIRNSKKDKVLAVIDSLPISSSQKDTLYYYNGWAESKLNEAPWH